MLGHKYVEANKMTKQGIKVLFLETDPVVYQKEIVNLDIILNYLKICTVFAIKYQQLCSACIALNR